MCSRCRVEAWCCRKEAGLHPERVDESEICVCKGFGTGLIPQCKCQSDDVTVQDVATTMISPRAWKSPLSLLRSVRHGGALLDPLKCRDLSVSCGMVLLLLPSRLNPPRLLLVCSA